VYSCRPLSKREALERGALGGDCSSDYVPLRALSPHHVYYGLFEGGAQRRGYVTVFEAWARTPEGERLPVLALETINAPLRPLESVQADLLGLFAAVAASRGLAGLAVVTGIGTWNYINERTVRSCRRFRRGADVTLEPADPQLWVVRELLAPSEAGAYDAFHARDTFRLVAPLAPALDHLQPENLAEIRRLEASPPRRPVITSWDAAGQPLAFISSMPGAVSGGAPPHRA